MSLDRQPDDLPRRVPKATRCPKCGSRDIDVAPNPNFPSAWELSCRAGGHEGDGGAPARR